MSRPARGAVRVALAARSRQRSENRALVHPTPTPGGPLLACSGSLFINSGSLSVCSECLSVYSECLSVCSGSLFMDSESLSVYGEHLFINRFALRSAQETAARGASFAPCPEGRF